MKKLNNKYKKRRLRVFYSKIWNDVQKRHSQIGKGYHGTPWHSRHLRSTERNRYMRFLTYKPNLTLTLVNPDSMQKPHYPVASASSWNSFWLWR